MRSAAGYGSFPFQVMWDEGPPWTSLPTSHQACSWNGHYPGAAAVPSNYIGVGLDLREALERGDIVWDPICLLKAKSLMNLMHLWRKCEALALISSRLGGYGQTLT